MRFPLNLFPKNELEQINAPEGRYYQRPNGNKYWSVTRYVDKIDVRKKYAIENWKRNVGKEKANRERDKAAKRGTAQHDYCERYIKGESFSVINPFHEDMFKAFQKELDENLGEVYGIEHRMYCDEFGLAGTADVLCKWDGKLSVVDFKTSKNVKSESMIYGYFLQSSIYGHMARNLHEFPVEQMVIVIGVDHYPECQTFVKEIDPYIEEVRKFHQENKNVLVY